MNSGVCCKPYSQRLGGEGEDGFDSAGVFAEQQVKSGGSLVPIVRGDTCNCTCMQMRGGRRLISVNSENLHGEQRRNP